MQKHISASDLRRGMYVQQLCGSWLEHPFWRSSFLIEEQATIDKIVQAGIAEVVIDTDLGADCEGEAEVADTPPAEPTEPVVSIAKAPAGIEVAPARPAPRAGDIKPAEAKPANLEAELDRARKICASSKSVVEAMFKQLRLGKALSIDAALPVVEDISASVLRNPTALISVARLKTADDYTYLHSVAVCALMMALARQLKLDEKTVQIAGLGGLMHDMGKAMVPLAILNKPGKLTDEEFAIIKSHPAEGHRIVSADVRDEQVLAIVLNHHEKVEGGGYPRGLRIEQLAVLDRMAAICDVYDAITSDRPYKSGWDPGESIRQMSSWKGHFDPALLKAFIKCLGIYPIGSLVRLASEKLAVVIEHCPTSLLTPKVKVFFSARSKSQVLVHIVDLAAPGCAERIVSLESPAKWGFRHLEWLWMP